MKNSTKGFAPIAIVIIAGVILVLASGGYWWWQNKTKVAMPVTNQQTTTSTQGDLEYHSPIGGNHEYKTVALSDIINNYDGNSVNNDVTTTGTIAFVEARTDGVNFPDMVLIDNSGSYLQIVIAHISWDEFAPTFSKLNIGDIVQVWGSATKTQGNLVTSSSGTRIESVGVNLGHAPFFGAISLYGIKKVDNTSAWKTYRNEKYGFEFKYPEGYEISDYLDEGAYVGVQKSETVYIKNPFGVNFSPPDSNKKYNSLNEFLLEQRIDIKQVKYSTVNGVPTAEVFIPDDTWGDSTDIYLLHNGLVYYIYTNVDRAPSSDEETQDLNKVISTFKFTK